jgi:hypothetical protein
LDAGVYAITITMTDEFYQESFQKTIETIKLTIEYEEMPTAQPNAKLTAKPSLFKFDYLANQKKKEQKTNNKFTVEIKVEPIKVWIDKVNRNGNITIRFSTNLTVPYEVQKFLNQIRNLRKE